MSNTSVFISVGINYNDNQETFISALENRLKGENLVPKTVGRNTFSSDAPLKTVIKLMDECSGTIIVALERTYFPTGIERRNSKKETPLNEIKYATCWNQIEAAMAYSKGQPIFVIVEEGIKTDGLLEKGNDWYVMTVKPEVTALSTIEFNGVLSSWKEKVQAYEEAKKREKKNIDTSSLTIGDLLKGLKPSHFWGILVALAGLVSGSFALGQYLAFGVPAQAETGNPTSSSSQKEQNQCDTIGQFNLIQWMDCIRSEKGKEPTPTEIKFKVISKNGHAVKGLNVIGSNDDKTDRIKLSSSTATTDATGVATFEIIACQWESPPNKCGQNVETIFSFSCCSRTITHEVFLYPYGSDLETDKKECPLRVKTSNQ